MSEQVTLLIETTPQVARRLERLAETGFYGQTRDQVAEELLRQALRDLATPDFVATREEALDNGDDEDDFA